MSLRHWNSVLERRRAVRLAQYTSLFMAEADDDSSASSSSDSGSDDDMSDSSYASDDSSIMLEELLKANIDVNEKLHTPKFNPSIEWGRRLRIDDIQGSDMIDNFRFRKEELHEICDKFWEIGALYADGEKESIRCINDYKCPWETGFLILLYRLHRPTRIRPDMENYFGMRRSHISAVIKTMTKIVYQIALPYLSDPSIFHNRMPLYAQKIREKSNLEQISIWGFIDGTLRKTCRPSYFQKLLYSGHKRCHGIKFQSVYCPDGIMALLFGPINGNRHDSFMLAKSGLLDQLEDLMPENGADPIYCLYGDPAYPQSRHLFGGFRNPPAGSAQAQWNTMMSKVRECVEWGFGDIVRYWSFLDFKASIKVFQSPVAKYYVIAAFLNNIRASYHGNETCAYFDCEPMSLDEYLGLVQH
jgi:hypothetical protein